jgi:hypothetical protein
MPAGLIGHFCRKARQSLAMGQFEFALLAGAGRVRKDRFREKRAKSCPTYSCRCGPSGRALVVVLERWPSRRDGNTEAAQDVDRDAGLGPQGVGAVEFPDALDASIVRGVLRGIATDDDRD